MRIDLHLHSTASDGELSPAQVVDGAVAGGLDVIALADHDTTYGVAAALEAVGNRALHVIPAIEVTSTWRGSEFHILGYFVDLSAEVLHEHDQTARARRRHRMERMLARLRELGLSIRLDEVLAHTQSERTVLARPHLARALVAAGYVADIGQAFDRYIGEGAPAFVATEILEPVEAVTLVIQAGGMAAWAHPPLEHVDALLPQLVASGLRGLEVYRLRTPIDQWAALEKICADAGLLATGGSDWHGPKHGRLGEFFVTREQVGPFLDAGGL